MNNKEKFPNQDQQNIFEERLKIAEDSDTSEQTILELFELGDKVIDLALARNPKTTEYTLQKLATRKDISTKCAVAQNPNTTQNTLEQLFNLGDSTINLTLARNPNTPSEILNKFFEEYINTDEINDYGESMKLFIINNTNTHPHVLRNIYNTDKSLVVRLRLARNQNTPEDILDTLYKDQNNSVRNAAMRNIAAQITDLE